MAQLTACIVPLNIFSVVAAILPPLRCKSHRIVRRSTCGNICCILSTATSRCLCCDKESRPCPLAPDEAFDGQKRYLKTSPPSTTTTTSVGMLISLDMSLLFAQPGKKGLSVRSEACDARLWVVFCFAGLSPSRPELDAGSSRCTRVVPISSVRRQAADLICRWEGTIGGARWSFSICTFEPGG